MSPRMSGEQRRQQILDIAATEFAAHGLYGASIDEIARTAGITQPYIFRMFGTKKALFLELIRTAFTQLTDGMAAAARDVEPHDALAAMGAHYFSQLADHTRLRLQLQGFAACGDDEVRDCVRGCFAALWSTTSDAAGRDDVTTKTFLAFGMLLNTAAALDVSDVDEPWSRGIQTLIRPGLFDHITDATNQ